MRLVAVLFAATLFVYASDCSHCAQKFEAAVFESAGSQGLYFKDMGSIATKSGHSQAIYNKFLGLYYLPVSHFQDLEIMYPYKETKAGLWSKGKAIEEVAIQQKQCGLKHFGSVSKATQDLSIVTGLCCHLLMLGNIEGKLIDAPYLKHFLNKKSATYGEIGVRFDEGARVKYINPYLQTPFEVGDKVVGYSSVCELKQKILFAKPGQKMEFKVQRDGRELQVVAPVYRRYGGGMISDSFLEMHGVELEQNLVISKIDPGSKAYSVGLRKGDEILGIKNNPLATQQELKQFLTTYVAKSYSYLINRGDFYFFVQI